MPIKFETPTEPTDNPQWYAVEFDETILYSVAPEDAPFVKRLLGVYFFDATERTFLCEATPSYRLEHLEDYIEFVDGVDEDKREELNGKYACAGGGNTHYIHVRELVGCDVVHYGELGEDETEDDVRDYWSCNSPFAYSNHPIHHRHTGERDAHRDRRFARHDPDRFEERGVCL